MGKDLIISQHALLTTLEHAADKAAFRQWKQESPDGEESDVSLLFASQQARAMLQTAAENPIGLHLLARRVLHGEAYESIAKRPFPVITHGLSYDALAMRVMRAKQMLRKFAAE